MYSIHVQIVYSFIFANEDIRVYVGCVRDVVCFVTVSAKGSNGLRMQYISCSYSMLRMQIEVAHLYGTYRKEVNS